MTVIISFQSVLKTTCFLYNPFLKYNSHSFSPTSSNTVLKQFKLNIKPPNWEDDASSRDTNIKIGSELIQRLVCVSKDSLICINCFDTSLTLHNTQAYSG